MVRGPAVCILSCHRVIDEEGGLTDRDRQDLARGCLSLGEFRRRVEFLAKRYRLLRLDKYVGRAREGKRESGVALTFDDASRDVYLNAWPVLRRMRVPFTVFLTTGWIDEDKRMLTSGQVREMANDPLITWGAHGVTHGLLPEMSDQEAAQEIMNSKAAVEGLTGRPINLFCYPDGKHDLRTQALLRKHGFAGACATGRRLNCGGVDVFALQRVPFENEPLARFAFRVAGLV